MLKKKLVLQVFSVPPMRQLRSIWDYFTFFEFGLSKSPFIWIFIVLLAFVLSSLEWLIGPRSWTISPNWGIALSVILAVLKLIERNVGSSRPKALKWQENTQLRTVANKLRPIKSDEDEGFKNIPPTDGFVSAVHLSESFNTKNLQNPNWDCEVKIEENSSRQDLIIDNLKRNSHYYKNLGRVTTGKQFFAKALVNEKKFGIVSDFTLDMKSVSLFRTDYYTTLCASERALHDCSELQSGERQVIFRARNRAPFDLSDPIHRLNSLSSESPPMTNQIGVNLLGVTRDQCFAICVQSHKALHSAGMRAPLASGSADQGDYEIGDTLKSFLKRAVFRELCEEWGRNPKKQRNKPLQMVDLMHLGVFRNPLRGGKPEFVVLAKLNWSSAELTPDSSEVEKYVSFSDNNLDGVKFRVDCLASLKKIVGNLINNSGAVDDSTSLYGSLRCLESAIKCNPSEVLKVLKAG